MNWIDIASIIFICVTMNHLGLIGAVEGIMGKRIPVINCPKCASFWLTLTCFMGKMGFSVIPQIPLVLAVSFLASYIAIWLELLEAFIDTLYLKLYEKIITSSNNDAVAADADNGNSSGTMSELQ